jgi:hypothetical protein
MRLLTWAARDAPPVEARVGADLRETNLAAVMPLAAYHRAGGLLREFLLPRVGPDHPLVAALEAGYADATRDHMRALWDLDRVKRVIDGTGARWAVVKGPVLVERLYRSPGSRPYLDLDVLVDPAMFPVVLDALEAAGATLIDRNWAVLRKELRGELHLVLAGGTPLDLHWNVVNMYRRRITFETAEVLDRVQVVQLGGIAVPGLEPTDALLHLAVHAGLSGGDRLIWAKDIERSISCDDLDWDALVERARRWRVRRVVGFMLRRSQAVLGARIPPAARRALTDPATERLIDIVDRLAPWEHALGRLANPNVMLARSIGHGSRGGLAWIAQRSVRNLDPRLARLESTLTPRGTPADRAAFLEGVRAQGRQRRT